jgi:hydrogenase-4 component F
LTIHPSIGAKTWLIVLGIISVGVAAFLIIQVKDYKRLFAFSTIEHMGIIMVAAGLGGYASHYGATLQIVSHAITKSFCFFAAGIALLFIGRQDIASVRGLIRTSPVTAIALITGGLAIAGAPPFAVFLSEIMILKSGIVKGQYLVTGLLAIFIIIAFCGILFPINRMVFGKPTEYYRKQKLSVTNIFALIFAAVPVILLGFYLPGPLQELLRLAAASLGK